MIDTLKTTKELLKRYNMIAKKSFGQNFLVDDGILESISNTAVLNKEDLIIEIGPGLGNLTYYLKEKCYLLLFEIDKRMIEVLNYRFKDEKNIKLLNSDILKVNIDEEIDKLEKEVGRKFGTVKVIANLPYYITSPILFKLLQESKKVEEIVVMVQNEVADRILAKPCNKDYGVLSIMVDYLADSKKEIIVPSTSFIPMPNVTSAVIKITKRKKYDIQDEKVFVELVHKAFANRRKKMINSLEINGFLNMDKEKLNNIFERFELSASVRAEELDTDKYVKIANYIASNII